MLKKLVFKAVIMVAVFALFVVPIGATEAEDLETQRMNAVLAFLASVGADMETEIYTDEMDFIRSKGNVVGSTTPAGAAGNVGSATPTGTANNVEERGTITSLSLEESIRLAVENNADIAIARIEHEQAMADFRQARREARSIHDLRRDRVPGVFTYDLFLAERILPKTMEMLEQLSYRTVEFRTNLVKFQVENAYYGILRAELELQNARESLARGREQLRITEVGFSAGINARADVVGAETSVAAQGLLVVFAENALRQARMDFSNLVGLALNEEIPLTTSFEFTPIELSIDEIKERAKERDITYIQLNKSYDIQRETLNLARSFFTPNVYAYQEAVRNYNIARQRLQNADQELELRIRRALLNAETARERFNLMETSMEQANENHRLISLRYEIGMATLLEVERASGEIDNAKAERLSAIYDYNLTVAMIRHGLFDLGGAGN